MTRHTRGVLAVPVGLALAGILTAGMAGLPDAGKGTSAYGDWVASRMVAVRGTTDVVAPVTLDVRGFDTLGEEFILFAAAAACALLLRTAREGRRPQDPDRADVPAIAAPPVRLLSRLLVVPVLVIGAYVVGHGTISPGGGFQGGVVLAAVPLLLFAGGRLGVVRRAAPTPIVEAVEAMGAGAFAVLGTAGLVLASAAFENFLGRGTPGELTSGGTIPLANVAVGVEVAAGFTLIFAELFEPVPEGDGR